MDEIIEGEIYLIISKLGIRSYIGKVEDIKSIQGYIHVYLISKSRRSILTENCIYILHYIDYTWKKL